VECLAGCGDDFDFQIRVEPARIAVRGAEFDGGGQISFRSAHGYEQRGTRDVDAAENCVTRWKIGDRAEALVVALVASAEAQRAVGQAEAARGVEEFDEAFLQAVFLLARGEAFAVLFFAKQTSARRGGKPRDAELFRKLHLRLARTPVEAEEFGAVKKTFALGFGGREVLRAERTHQHVGELRVARNDAERLAVLRHGALSENFAGRDEVEAEFLHEFARAQNHAAVAVDAGIHRAAKTVRRMIEERKNVVGEIEDVEFHIEFLRGAPGVANTRRDRGVPAPNRPAAGGFHARRGVAKRNDGGGPKRAGRRGRGQNFGRGNPCGMGAERGVEPGVTRAGAGQST